MVKISRLDKSLARSWQNVVLRKTDVKFCIAQHDGKYWTDSYLMLPSTILWITWATLSFCALCLPNPFHIYLLQIITCCWSQVSYLVCLYLSLYMPSLKHNTVSCNPNLSTMVITITVSCITVTITEFKFPLEFLVFPWRHHFRKSTLARLLNTGVTASITAFGSDS